MNKKYLGLVGLGCGVLLLTGCGSANTLNCSMDMDDMLAGLGTMKAEVELEYDKDGKEVKGASMKMVVEITNDDVTDDMLDSLEEELNGQCEDGEGDFDDCSVKRDGKKITLKASGDVEKIAESEEIAKDTTKEKAKEYFEEQGFTCE